MREIQGQPARGEVVVELVVEARVAVLEDAMGPAAVLDVNLAMELNPNSCTGAGDGKWFSLTYTSDGRHETNLAQKTILPARFSPTGTNPAAVFAP